MPFLPAPDAHRLRPVRKDVATAPFPIPFPPVAAGGRRGQANPSARARFLRNYGQIGILLQLFSAS